MPKKQKPKAEDPIFEGETPKVEEETAPPSCEIPPEPVSEIKGDNLTKKKRVLSDETKARLKEQLKKGRETALANRQRKAQVKKIDKQETVDKQEKKIIEAAVKSQKIKSVVDPEVEALRKELAELKSKQQPQSPVADPVSKKQKPPSKSPKVAIKKQLDNHVVEEEKKEEKSNPPPKPAAAPLMTSREQMRRMKGIF